MTGLQSRAVRWYLGVFVLATALMIILPPPYSFGVFIAAVAGSIGLVAQTHTRVGSIHIPIPVLSLRISYTLEMGFIAMCLLVFAPALRNFSPDVRMPGAEFSYLVNSGAVAAQIVHRTGSIPVWNPFMGIGEPLLENPFSFVLNPLMTLPIVAWGPVQGAKAALLLHVGLMAAGGWMLALSLRLGAPGRLLLALLVSASGGFVGAVSGGFYQMGLSQAYVPWIYAGLIGMLYPPDGAEHTLSRPRSMAILVVAASLMIFAGTYWYVLPAMIGCALLTVFAAIRRGVLSGRSYKLFFLSLVQAALLILGFSAVRLLPQIVHHDYVHHPAAWLFWRQTAFVDMLRLLFYPDLLRPEENNHALYYHYTVPAIFIASVAVLFILRRIARHGEVTASPVPPDSESDVHPGGSFIKTIPRWRIFLPALLAVGLFTAWSQEGTQLIYDLYDRFPLLAQWRFLGRMLAAASPWAALLAAVMFDDVVTWASWQGTPPETSYTRSQSVSLPRFIAIAVLVCFGGWAVFHVQQNWKTVYHTQPVASYAAPIVRYLRAEHPNAFLSVLTFNYFNDYLPFYENLTRASFGNPDYQPASIPVTLGSVQPLWYLTEYAVPGDEVDQEFLISQGYKPLISPPLVRYLLWHSAAVPSYAYVVGVDRLEDPTPLKRSETRPVTTFTHNIDSIQVQVNDYLPGDVLVVTETAYPGWRVTINGAAAKLESVGGLLGVRLPVGEGYRRSPVELVFTYAPVWLAVGGFMTALTAGMIAFILLRPLIRRSAHL